MPAFWASCSIAGTGSGRSIGTARSTEMASVRTASERSIDGRGPPPEHGSRPAPPPHETSAARRRGSSPAGGPAASPGRRASAPRLSSTPNTRASTWSGTIRAISVNAVTSTMALPTPMTPAATSATAYSCHRPITPMRHAPQHDGDRQPAGHRAAADQQGGQGAADEGADAHRALDHPDAGLATVQQVDRDDHDQHGERPADHRLQHHEDEDGRHAAVAAHGVQPLAHLADQVDPPGRRVVEPLVRQTQHQDGRDQAADAGEDEDRGHVADADEQGGDEAVR